MSVTCIVPCVCVCVCVCVCMCARACGSYIHREEGGKTMEVVGIL